MQSPNPDASPSLFSTTEREIFIQGAVGKLELRLLAGTEPDVNRVAIICHPHPLHGGTMDNKVVTTLVRSYRDLGWHSVRFNFRGVGKSEGEHGYLQGEIEDLGSVLAYVREHMPHASIGLAGFSFGSAVAANVAVLDANIDHLILVAPPVGKYDLDFPAAVPCPTLVIQGDQDDVVDLARTRGWAKGMGADFDYCEIPGAGHFFHGNLTILSELVKDRIPLSRQSNKRLS